MPVRLGQGEEGLVLHRHRGVLGQGRFEPLHSRRVLVHAVIEVRHVDLMIRELLHAFPGPLGGVVGVRCVCVVLQEIVELVEGLLRARLVAIHRKGLLIVGHPQHVHHVGDVRAGGVHLSHLLIPRDGLGVFPVGIVGVGDLQVRHDRRGLCREVILELVECLDGLPVVFLLDLSAALLDQVIRALARGALDGSIQEGTAHHKPRDPDRTAQRPKSPRHQQPLHIRWPHLPRPRRTPIPRGTGGPDAPRTVSSSIDRMGLLVNFPASQGPVPA